MKRLILATLTACTLAARLFAADAPLNELTAAEKTAGWKLLFDGKDASASWRNYKKETISDKWVVKDGELSLIGKGGGDLITKEKFESFEFSLDWKISEGGNSGVMFKVQELNQPPYFSGPEAQIQDNVKGHDPQKAGWMYGLYPASVDTTKPAGEWNTFVLKCQKTPEGTFKCEHTMNGTKYVEYEIGSADWAEKVAKSKFAKWDAFGKAEKGHICLQDHGNVVSFRNIKIRELK
ncbi:MAG: DUF1080 domain-containing protein [Chthoniobacter sp.]|nr:DUF1080 domain-containing protein [Chthoniobacter sp.]